MTTILDRVNDPCRREQDIVHVPVSAIAFLWSRTDMVSEIWHVVQTVAAWDGAEIQPDSSGLCLKLRGVTIGHLGWQGRIDLPFGAQMRDQIRAERIAGLYTYQRGTDRLAFDLRTPADVDRALWLLRLAFLAEDPQTVPTCN